MTNAPATTTTPADTSPLWEEFGADDTSREANLREAVRRSYAEIKVRPHLHAYFKDENGDPLPTEDVEPLMVSHLALAAQAPSHLFPHPPMDLRYAHLGQDRHGNQVRRDLGITKEHAVETVGIIEKVLTDMGLAESTVEKVVQYLFSRAGDVISPKVDTAGAAA